MTPQKIAEAPRSVSLHTSAAIRVHGSGCTVLDVIDEDGLRERRVVGKRLRNGLEELKRAHDLVGDVAAWADAWRGAGP